MKNLMFIVVLFFTISGFARILYPECGDGETRSSVSFTQVQNAAEQLAQVAQKGNDQAAILLRLGLISGKSNPGEMTQPQYLAHAALTQKREPIESEIRGHCPSQRGIGLDNLQMAERLILDIRQQLATEAMAR